MGFITITIIIETDKIKSIFLNIWQKNHECNISKDKQYLNNISKL